MTAPTKPPAAPHEDGSRAKTLRGLLLARELDEARQARGFTTRTLAAAMSMSPAMLNRVMTGRRVPTALEIGGLCALLDIPAARRPALYERTATSEQTEWVIHPGTARNPLRDIESFADAITWFDPDRVPRPLRTLAYDNAVERTPAAHSPLDPAALRLSTFLLHPRALDNPGLPEDVHRDQLRHLLDAHLPRLRLVSGPVGAFPGFRVLTITHFPPIVHIEHCGTDIILENPSATSAHTEHLDHIAATAMSPATTREAILHRIR